VLVLLMHRQYRLYHCGSSKDTAQDKYLAIARRCVAMLARDARMLGTRDLWFDLTIPSLGLCCSVGDVRVGSWRCPLTAM